MGIYNKTIANWIEIIYLQLYKDTDLIFMQAYEPLLGIHYYLKKYRNIYFQKSKVFINTKVKIFIKSRS